MNCKEDYSRLSDFGLDPQAHQALFRALLHSRLALLTIRAALQLAGHVYPSEVDVVTFEPRSDAVLRRPDGRVLTGREVFDSAQTVEALIVEALNSFAPSPSTLDVPSTVEDVFQLLNTHRVLIDGQEVARHVLIMFDDAHVLDAAQRRWLISELERHDTIAFASWVAMRLDALQPPCLISEAVRPDRERLSLVPFEELGQSRIEKWLLDVGDRRARRAQTRCVLDCRMSRRLARDRV